MNVASTLILVLATTGLVLPAPSQAQTSTAPGAFLYVPPDRGAPPARVSGGTRGPAGSQVAVRVLAPEHTGLTLREQPTLYWYLSEAVDNAVVVTLVDEESIDPVLEVRLDPPLDAGIQRVALTGRGVRLELDKTYQWGVSLVAEADDRFKDVYAGGAISRVAGDAVLRAKLADSKAARRASVLAESGIWYDAIDELSKAMGHSGQMSGLLAQRRSLLLQVGLPTVASYEAR